MGGDAGAASECVAFATLWVFGRKKVCAVERARAPRGDASATLDQLGRMHCMLRGTRPYHEIRVKDRTGKSQLGLGEDMFWRMRS